jgi:hypothetical protein
MVHLTILFGMHQILINLRTSDLGDRQGEALGATAAGYGQAVSSVWLADVPWRMAKRKRIKGDRLLRAR